MSIRILCLLNKERESFGRQPLSYSKNLDLAAKVLTVSMAVKKTTLTPNPNDLEKRAGKKYVRIASQSAIGDFTPEEFFTNLMKNVETSKDLLSDDLTSFAFSAKSDNSSSSSDTSEDAADNYYYAIVYANAGERNDGNVPLCDNTDASFIGFSKNVDQGSHGKFATLGTRKVVLEEYAKDTNVHFNPVRLTCLINKERIHLGRSPLGLSFDLDSASRRHSMDMAESKFVSHIGSDNSTPESRADFARFAWITLAENVGRGYQNENELLTHWLARPEFRNNILGPEVSLIGSSVALSSEGVKYWTIMTGSDVSTDLIIPNCDQFTSAPESIDDKNFSGSENIGF